MPLRIPQGPRTIEKVAAPGSDVDLVPEGAIMVVGEPENRRIRIGETHSQRTDNPHHVTAAQVGAPVSVGGVSNPGGDIALDEAGAILIIPDTLGRQIVIGETHSARTDNPHQTTAEQVGAVRNEGGMPSQRSGPESERPAPGIPGRLYVASDTRRIWRDTGTEWVTVGVVNWGDIEGKPAAFPPVAHAASHAQGGTDPITPAAIGAVAKAGDSMEGPLAFGSYRLIYNDALDTFDIARVA